MKNSRVHVVGAGLAGSEAAYFLAENGVEVVLHEMRPLKMTPAHKTDLCAELVCSNSLKAKSPASAPGMLKAEMNLLGSLVLRAAGMAAIPGGGALTVDRDVFSGAITRTLRSHSNIALVQGEVTSPPPQATTLLATGPLTSDALSQFIADSTESRDLYFYDAISPIVDASTIDMDHAFLANRYGKGDEAAYINCPLTEDEYHSFVDALMSGEKVPPQAFEEEKFFQGCQPIEAIAAGGRESLRFGPMKPVGLTDPRTGQRPYAVLQLRPENKACTAYNLVGFQTKLKYGEQSRIFRLIPALKNIEFLRFGSIHRNTYVCGPRVLRPDLSLKGHPNVYLGGQITGVEGYLESAAIGLLAALFIKQRLEGKPHNAPPANTALGALLRHVTSPGNGDASDAKFRYDPSNIHFGLFDVNFFDQLSGLNREEAREQMAIQALSNFSRWKDQL